MSDQHLTDEEIHDLGGAAPRVPVGIPMATCLACGEEYHAFYACMAHDCDSNVPFAERRPYMDWLVLFQRLGFGVLKDPANRKFESDKLISGRTALTFHLQSDLNVGPGLELNQGYYISQAWKEPLSGKRGP